MSGFNPSFRIQGQVYHLIGSIVPIEGESPKFAPIYVTGPAKINHVSAKDRRFFPSLLYHNVRTVYTNAIKSLSLLLKLMGYLLKFTEMGYHIQN